jgi:mRNA interferase HigB
MHVISLRPFKDFWAVHPPAQVPLAALYKGLEKAEFKNLVELRKIFPSADLVKDKYVFNVGGNKYRVITSIHFNRQKVFIREVLTHAEYDQGAWK